MYRTTIEKLTCDELRQKLAELNLQTSGLKVDLQNRLLQHYEVSEETVSDVESEKSVYVNATEAVAQTSHFTLKDIQNSISSFGGSQSENVGQWVDEFEDNATAVGWNKLQKFIYAKQLLKGAAKMFVKSQKGIETWDALKEVVNKEFSVKLSSSKVHRRLKSRKKKTNESFPEYLYCLMEIGSVIG